MSEPLTLEGLHSALVNLTAALGGAADGLHARLRAMQPPEEPSPQNRPTVAWLVRSGSGAIYSVHRLGREPMARSDAEEIRGTIHALVERGDGE